MGKILKRYERFRWAQYVLCEAVQMSIEGTCDSYWLDSCIEAFEMAKTKIRKGME